MHTLRKHTPAREATNEQAGARAQTHKGCRDHPESSGISKVRRSEDSSKIPYQAHTNTTARTKEEAKERRRGRQEWRREGVHQRGQGKGREWKQVSLPVARKEMGSWRCAW